jgi:hypothetical protein
MKENMLELKCLVESYKKKIEKMQMIDDFTETKFLNSQTFKDLKAKFENVLDEFKEFR